MIREKEAAHRCADLYEKRYGCRPADIEPIKGSGSNRRYFRLMDGTRSVIAVAGTSLEENMAFVYFSEKMKEAGVNVPEVYETSSDGMTYLQSDCGNVSLHSFMQQHRGKDGSFDNEAMRRLSQVMQSLPDIQFMPQVLKGKGAVNSCDEFFDHCYQQREFDRTGVMFDLNYFKYDYLKLTGLEFDELRLQRDFELLADDLLYNVSDTFLYRDFQSRNVLLSESGPCFIDYQGGRRGPLFYDVASFLWQSSARFTDDMRMKLIDVYLHSLNRYERMDKRTFMSRLHMFALFRILQVLGAYGFRGLWEKKDYFINSIPMALSNLGEEIALGTCDKYPYLREVCSRLIEAHRQGTAEKNDNGVEKHDDAGKRCDAQSYLASDTSYLNAHPERPLVVRVFSFAFKKGIPADNTGNGGGFVFDCRSTHNPGRYEEFKPLTGLDKPVIDFLENDGEILTYLESVYKLVDFQVKRFMERGFTDMQVSFGCTGGKHRSVYCAQHVAEHINQIFGVEVQLCHRERGISSVLPAHCSN